MKLLAVDPGNVESGYVILQTVPKSFKILNFGNVPNHELLTLVKNNQQQIDIGLIERIQSYNQVVGETVFDTCRMIGKLEVRLLDNKIKTALIYRKSVISHHLGSVSVKNPDSKLRKHLIDKYKTESKGLTSHSWQALALATMYLESRKLIC